MTGSPDGHSAPPAATGASRERTVPVHPGQNPAFNLVTFAAWLAIGVWAVEYTILSIRKFVFDERTVWYLESMWLAALVYAAVFSLLGLLAASLARRSPKVRRVAVQILIGFAVLSVLLVFTSLHRAAALLLAMGAGFQLGSVVAGRPDRTARLVRRTLPGMAAITAITVLVLTTIEPIREWRALRALPPADANAPNIILLILDTVRASQLGLYGYERPLTPSLDAFAARAMTFDQAYSTASWTLPSHFSMFTGLYSHEMPDAIDDFAHPDLGPDRAHISEVLSARGYATAGFMANMSYTTDEAGLSRGFLHWDDHTISPGQMGISTAPGRTILANGRLRRLLDWHDFPIRKPAGRVNEAMLKWIDGHRDRPFFVVANYFDAHGPYAPPDEFADRFATGRPRAGYHYHPHASLWWDKRNQSAEEFLAQRGMYDAALAWLDSELGQLFARLDERGLSDNTLIIVTSDHGEEFGEHGSLGHGGEVYVDLIRVPLIIAFPGQVPRGVRVDEPVTLADLPATILDLIGVHGHSIPGATLADAWGEDPVVPDSPILSQENSGRAKAGILVDGWHYMRQQDGAEELYHLAVDSTELNDLIADPLYADRLVALRLAMDSALAIRR